ncbi:MAG TPA: lysophospholipid acyltransferase family protein [Solirubrobacter sp.]|nr:lysophospholipid acyltransferase family protein [Solirubrobacter sp.]
MTNEDAHCYAREHGTSTFFYGGARILLRPIAAVWYRMSVTGREHIPAEGPVIIAPNHRHISDPFFIGLATKRRVHYMAKSELFDKPGARVLNRLGAYPVRRGEADPEALETSRVHLERGRVIAIFPEGTRSRDPERLRRPRKGAARLALEAQAPIVPCAITGTDRLARGPVKIRVAFAPPIQPAQLEVTPDAAADLIANQVWPEVEREYARLRAHPGVIAAILGALGAGAAGGGVAYRRQQRRKRKRSRNPFKRS